MVDLKVGDQADIKNLIERLECNCIEASGEDAKIIDVKIIDRKLLITLISSFSMRISNFQTIVRPKDEITFLPLTHTR